MNRLDKLILEAEKKVLTQVCKAPYDFSRLSTEVLKNIVEDKYTEQELELILAPVKVFDSTEEADEAYYKGFTGMAFIDDVEE